MKHSNTEPSNATTIPSEAIGDMAATTTATSDTTATTTVSERISPKLQSMSSACCIAVIAIIALINLFTTMCYVSPYDFRNPYFDATAAFLGVITAAIMLCLLANAGTAIRGFRLRHVTIASVVTVGAMAVIWVAMNQTGHDAYPGEGAFTTGDTGMVIGYAREMFKGNTDGLYAKVNEYMQRYPYQSGVVLMVLPMVAMTMRLGFDTVATCLQYANVPVVMLAALLIIIIAWLMAGAEAAKRTAIMSVMFAPLWMSATQVYGNVYSLPLLLAMVAIVIMFSRTDSRRGIALSSVGILAIAFVLGALKPNSLIMGIAVVITLILMMPACLHHAGGGRTKAHAAGGRREEANASSRMTGRREKNSGRIKAVAAAVMAMLVIPLMLAGGVVSRAAVERLSGIEFDQAKAQPMSFFIGMGLGDESDHGNGFYLRAIGGAWTDMAAEREKSDASIGNRLGQMRTDPMGAAGFFSLKALQTWGDPTFSYATRVGCEIFNHAAQRAESEGIAIKLDETASQRIVNTDAFMIATRTWCDGISIIIACAAFIGFRRMRRRKCHPQSQSRMTDVADTLPALFVLGGFLFHIAWETQPEYAFTYFVMLIPYAGVGLLALMDAWKAGRLLKPTACTKAAFHRRNEDGTPRPCIHGGDDGAAYTPSAEDGSMNAASQPQSSELEKRLYDSLKA